MNRQREEVISAALDGETVDLGELSRALSLEEGRELLASFVLIRAEVAADNIRTSRPLPEAGPDVLDNRPVEAFIRPAGSPAIRVSRVLKSVAARPRVGLGVAASIVALTMAGAFWCGTVWRANVALRSASQVAGSNTVVPVAGPEVSGSAPAPRSMNAPEPKVPSIRRPAGVGNSDRLNVPPVPPTPTRILRFNPGTEWQTGL
jgi:hypothetical protein